MKKTKQEWIELLTQQYGGYVFSQKTIHGKKQLCSDFYLNATEEQKNDRYLQALNYEKYGHGYELPIEMIDFSFVKQVFNLKESIKVTRLSYEWKNNSEEKKFLKHILEVLGSRSTDYRNHEIMWTFEPGFWEDLSFTETIKKHDYEYLNLAIIKELNLSKQEEHIEYLKQIVDSNCYYLKYIKTKHKSQLKDETILAYARDYGLTCLTKEQKNRYEVVKTSLYNYKIDYDKLDIKFKTKDILIDLLNYRDVWTINYNSKDIININQLSPELLEDKEVIKACLSYGGNLLALKRMNSHWYEDKELKLLSLKTYADYKIIEDCMYDKEMVLEFLININTKSNHIYSSINLFEQCKRIPTEIFENMDVMLTYLTIEELNQKEYIVPSAIKAFEKYNITDLKLLVGINKEVYKCLSEELKGNWEIIEPFYEQNRGVSTSMPQFAQDMINKLGNNFEENLQLVKKLSLEEKLIQKYNEKETIKRLKI